MVISWRVCTKTHSSIPLCLSLCKCRSFNLFCESLIIGSFDFCHFQCFYIRCWLNRCVSTLFLSHVRLSFFKFLMVYNDILTDVICDVHNSSLYIFGNVCILCSDCMLYEQCRYLHQNPLVNIAPDTFANITIHSLYVLRLYMFC